MARKAAPRQIDKEKAKKSLGPKRQRIINFPLDRKTKPPRDPPKPSGG